MGCVTARRATAPRPLPALAAHTADSGWAGHNFTDLFSWNQRAPMHGVAGLPAGFAPRGLLGRLAFDVRPIGGGRLEGVLRISPQLLSHLRHFALQRHNAALVPVNDHPQCRLRRCWNLRPQLWRQGRRARHRATALISTATALQVRGVKEYYRLFGRGDSNH